MKAAILKTYDGARLGVGHVSKFNALVFGSRSLNPRDRGLRTLAIMAFLFLLLNGTAFHIVGLFWAVMKHGILPLANWPEGTMWWQSTLVQANSLNMILAGAALAVLVLVLRRFLWKPLALLVGMVVWFMAVSVLTDFPWGSLPAAFNISNIPFAIAALSWLIVAGMLFASLVRTWKLAYKDLNDDLMQLVGRTFLVVLAEVILVLALVWLFDNQGWAMDQRFWTQVLGWGWQLPVGYFVGKGLNWSIESRERAGLIATREQPTAALPVEDIHHTPLDEAANANDATPGVDITDERH